MIAYVYLTLAIFSTLMLHRIALNLTRIMVGISVLCEAQIAWLRHSNEPEELGKAADSILAALAVLTGTQPKEPQE